MEHTNSIQSGETGGHRFTWSWEQIKSLFVKTYNEWNIVEAPRMGASLAYYTILSLAPLLVIVIAIAGWVFGEQASRGALVAQIQGLVGREGAEAIQGIIQHAASKKATGTVASIIGFVVLLFGASSVAIELRSALDKIWNVKEPEGLAGFIKARSYALAVVLGAGFLLLASLVISTALAALGKFFGGMMPIPAWVAEVVNGIISLLVITGVLAAIFKLLPAAPITWRDVSIGAAFTAVLFTVGKTLIGIYLGRASVGSSYGAAEFSLAFWCGSTIRHRLFCAEFTRVYANDYGSKPAVKSAPPEPTSPRRVGASRQSSYRFGPSHRWVVPPSASSVEKSVAILIGSAVGLTVAAVKCSKRIRRKRRKAS